MNPINDDFGDFTFDDDEFAAGAGINKITKAYVPVLKSMSEKCQEAIQIAESGGGKELARIINTLVSRASGLVQLQQLDKRIVGPGGKVFNIFGQTIDLDEDPTGMSMGEEITEEQAEEIIQQVLNGITTVSLGEAEETINKANIEDDGLSHGDLDDINW